MNIIRLFSTSLKTVSNSELAQLRKRTGFSLVNCRNALKLNKNNVDEAEKWLKKEAKRLGWEKAMKLENRTATEGLIAIAQTKNKVVMAEVNCETDFVARNKKFVSLCQIVARTCLSHKIPELNKNTKKILLTEELGNLETPEKEKLNDFVVGRIAEFGENILLKRALFYEADDNIQINVSVHPPITDEREICTGKYGAFVAYKKLPESASDDCDQSLGVNLCRHIIGFNPTKVGSSEDLPSNVSSNAVEIDSVPTENDMNSDDVDPSILHSLEETALIHQDFILTPEKTVGEVLNEHGVTVIDFHRFQCGEVNEIKNENEDHEEGNMKMRRAEGN